MHIIYLDAKANVAVSCLKWLPFNQIHRGT